MAELEKQLEAQKLRENGKSIKEIAMLIQVSPGSVSSWCKNISLTAEQKIALEKRRVDPNFGKRKEYLIKQHELFSDMVDALKKEGINQIGKLTKREIFLIGIALYWGEGFKKDHQVGFANTDPNMLLFFICWLETCFNIQINDLIIRVTLNIHHKEKINNIILYWSKQLSIPINQFSKPYFQNTIQKKKYESDDAYHGVLRIKVRKSVNLLRKIYGFIEGISLNVT